MYKFIISIVMAIFITTTLEAKSQETFIKALSSTKFEVTDKNGNKKIVDLKGKKFIVVSVREPGSDGKSYAVDEDGTIWWHDVISSGAQGGHETTTGIFPVILKRRFHMSATHPDKSGINNMDFEILFTQDGQALHLGNVQGMSHGCVHVGRKDIEAMFKWIDTKSKIVVLRGRYVQFLNAEIRQFNKEIRAYDKNH